MPGCPATGTRLGTTGGAQGERTLHNACALLPEAGARCDNSAPGSVRGVPPASLPRLELLGISQERKLNGKIPRIDLTASQWASLAGNWRQREADFMHQPTGVPPNSFNFFICDKQLKDGAIEGTVRVSQGGDGSGKLVFRYGPSGCYYAGVGGYGRHFVIVKYVCSNDAAVSVGMALAGLQRDTHYEEPYHLRVEFIGDTITLKSSGVTVLEATDTWFEGT